MMQMRQRWAAEGDMILDEGSVAIEKGLHPEANADTASS